MKQKVIIPEDTLMFGLKQGVMPNSRLLGCARVCCGGLKKLLTQESAI